MMMTRKTKRNSPPPLKTTIDTIDNKMSKVLVQLITPPNKKRRAIALIGQSQQEIEDDSQVLIKQKKLLNRRAVCIETLPPPPPPVMQINDGPQGTRHKWIMYCKTLDKLRNNSLPLLETMQLRKLLVKLQNDESIQQRIATIQKEQQKRLDDDDNTPLHTLLKRISPPYKQSLPLFHLSSAVYI